MNEPSVAVVGLGLLGRGIAACLLQHGFKVVGYDRSAQGLADASQSINEAIRELVVHNVSPPSLNDAWRARFVGTTSLADIAPCGFVIESVVEDAAVKGRVFDEIERLVASDTPIASNTSALPISRLQQSRTCPERFVGMHWAEPAHATRFLELIRGEQTGDAAWQAAADLASRCGKEPTFVNRDVPGFVANRIGYAMYREALHLLSSGVADAEMIDRSFRNSVGLWATLCGPFRWMDLTGGPALYDRAMAPVTPDLNRDATMPSPLSSLASENAQGITNGRGFYSYTAQESKAWEALLRRHAWEIKRLMDSELPLDDSHS